MDPGLGIHWVGVKGDTWARRMGADRGGYRGGAWGPTGEGR